MEPPGRGATGWAGVAPVSLAFRASTRAVLALLAAINDTSRLSTFAEGVFELAEAALGVVVRAMLLPCPCWDVGTVAAVGCLFPLYPIWGTLPGMFGLYTRSGIIFIFGFGRPMLTPMLAILTTIWGAYGTTKIESIIIVPQFWIWGMCVTIIIETTGDSTHYTVMLNHGALG